jgi:hypothetical protein
MADFTVFTNGTNLRQCVLAGSTAGAFATPASVGVEVGDTIQQVLRIRLKVSSTSLCTLSSCVDLTSEFVNPVDTADQVENTGGTNSTNALLLVLFNDQNPNA